MQNFDLFRVDGHALRVFLSVCETGSVSRTAELFNLNQSTISHTLEKMRSAFGDPLFVKSGRGITPTEKALGMVPRVQQILADIEGLVTPESYDASKDARPIVLGISTPALLNDMRALHAKALQEAPGIKLDIKRLAPRDRLQEMLSQDEAEVAICVAGFRYGPTLNHCVYGTEKSVVYYDPNVRGPVTTVEEYAAARHGVVNFGGSQKSEVEKRLAELGMKREVALVAPTASMLGDLIAGTDIIATMPQRLSEFAYRGLSYAMPPFGMSDIVYDLVWHRRYDRSGRNTWLRNLILESRQG